MSTQKDPYDLPKAAARRWLERSHDSDYWQKKLEDKKLQRRMATLKRNTNRTGDSQAIALIEKIKHWQGKLQK